LLLKNEGWNCAKILGIVGHRKLQTARSVTENLASRTRTMSSDELFSMIHLSDQSVPRLPWSRCGLANWEYRWPEFLKGRTSQVI
jgi:hypothetical protein